MKMKTSKIAFYGLMIISIALTLATFTTAQSGSQPPLPVKVTNTEPVPVAGTVNIANSPTAPLSVTGNVNVSGQVTVGNTVGSPLAVRDLNNIAKTPIQLSGSCAADTPGFGCSRIIDYPVPTGKLMVVEHVSTRFEGPTGTRGKVVILTCMETFGCRFPISPGVFEDQRPGIYLDPTGFTGSWTGTTEHAGTSQKVLVFGNDRDSVSVLGQCSPFNTCSDNYSFKVTITGYLIDKP
jgi:hypothetical protein